GQGLQEELNLLALARGQAEKGLGRGQSFSAMESHGVGNRVRSTIMQIRGGVAQAPERRRAPFSCAGAELGRLFPGSRLSTLFLFRQRLSRVLRGDDWDGGSVRAGITQ